MDKCYLKDIALHISDGEHGTVHDSPSNFLLLSNKNIVDGRIVVSNQERTISEEDFKRINKRAKVQKNSILISTVGEIGKTAFVHNDDINFTFQRSVGIVNVNESKANPYFVYLYLQLPYVQKYMDAKSKGSVQKCLFINDMCNLEIYLPDLSIQNKISSVIGNIDKKIYLNTQINAELESLAKTIYDYWFLQFDFPNKEGKPYKSSGGAMVWNEDLKMEIPEGWRTCRLGDMADLYLGGTPKTEIPSYWNGDINWLSSGEISQFPVVSAETKITEDGVNNSATKLMQKGTVVVSITGNIRVSILAIDSCANQSVVGINENEILENSYIYPVVGHLLDHYEKLSTGNCQQHINKNTLEETTIVVPPKEVLDKYYAVVNPMYEKIMNDALESQTLKETRDFLLPLLMNGQVGFKDA